MIIIRMPDTPATRLMAEALKANLQAEVTEEALPPLLSSVDERMKYALECLRREHVLVHKYDYVWIMRYINEEQPRPTGLFFISIKSYRTYLTLYLGIDQMAGISTLSFYYSSGEGRFPEWTFTDTPDSTERVRRINVARRFAAIFFKSQ
ncbi:MAG: hypothetical protein IJ588_11430 [Prevotella sp.]|nr:hypothetical protein [Prevotella sp.]